MSELSKHRLVLVDDPVQIDLTVDRTAFARGSSGQEGCLPLCVRLTMEQVFEAADDADLRAQVLEWSTSQIPSVGVVRKTSSLHEVASDLRRIAAHLQHDWAV